MKFLKTPFLFFFVCCLLQLVSCSETGAIKPIESAALDSINFYSQKMKDPSFSDSVCLIYADKAIQYAVLHKQETKISKILKYKTSLFAKLKLHDSAIYTSRELLKQTVKTNDSAAISGAFLRVGYYYDAKYQKDSAYYFYKQSNEISIALRDSVKIGHGLVRIAIIQSDLGDYIGSDNTAVKALKYLKKGDYAYLSSIYNCLAISSRKQKDYNEAIYWYDKAIKIATINSNKIKYLQNKSNAYRYMGNFDKSIAILDSLNGIPIKSKKTIAIIIDNLAYAKWLNGDESGVSSGLHEAMNIRLDENDYWGLLASYSHLSEFYKNEDTKLSLEFAKKMYQLANQQKSPRDQLEALQKLIDLDTSLKVKEYYTSYVRINDSLQFAESRAKNKFAKIKYDSEKNREDNLQLKIVSTNQDLALQKEKTNNIFLFTSGSFIFAGLLFFIYYKKQKHVLEKRTEVYNTEKRIAKKIHDEVANDVVNIMNKIQYTEHEPDKILDDLEHVYLLTRDISHENNEIATGENFELQLKSMLANFNSIGVKIIIKDIHKVEFSLTSKEKQIEIYRILQELMVNMHKHSKATLVVISFKMEKKMCFINYSDNGIGIDTESLILKNGLKNTENRIKAINGTITFESKLDKGFKVYLSFKR